MSRLKVKRVGEASRPRAQDNSHPGAKVQIRRYVLDLLRQEGTLAPRILDVFCGAGMMWRQAYDRTPHYLGLDTRLWRDERRTIVTDNRRYLRHVGAHLDQYDLFDLDAYGSPAECFALVVHRVQWTRTRVIGVVMTEGSWNANLNGLPSGMLATIGVARHQGGKVQAQFRDLFAGLFLETVCRAAHLQIEALRRIAYTEKAAMRYLGFLLRKGEAG